MSHRIILLPKNQNLQIIKKKNKGQALAKAKVRAKLANIVNANVKANKRNLNKNKRFIHASAPKRISIRVRKNQYLHQK